MSLWTCGGGAGADRRDGGADRDLANYADAGAGLGTPSANTGEAAGDSYVSIENLCGSHFNDSLRGDNSANAIYGAGGNDVLYGRGGNDILLGNAGNDRLVGGAGADRLYGEGGGSGRFHLRKRCVFVADVNGHHPRFSVGRGQDPPELD